MVTTKFINESSSCIDFIFSSSVNHIKNRGVDRHFMKYVTTISSLNFNIPLFLSRHREIWGFRNAISEICDLFKKQYQTLTGRGLSLIRFGYRAPELTKKKQKKTITLYLKKRSTLTKSIKIIPHLIIWRSCFIKRVPENVPKTYWSIINKFLNMKT